MNQEYSWLQIEFAEEILGITSANLLPYGNNPEEAYALRTFFPELYRQYLASNR